MEFKNLLINKYKHYLTSLLFLIPVAWFLYCEKTLIPKHYMFSRIDLLIPFIKEFIIIYILWYGYLVFGFIYLGYVSKEDYYKLFAFLFSGMCISYIIYTIYPNAQNLRPNITGTDIFSAIVKWIYSVDTPTNVCPSIHVVGSIAVYLGFAKCEKLKQKHLLKLSVFILMALIIVSTMFVKQHSVVDVTWGCVLSMVLYIPVYMIPELVKEKRVSEKSENRIGRKKRHPAIE